MTNIFDELNQLDYDFFFLVVDKFLDIEIPQLTNFHSIYDQNLSTKNSGFLISQKSTQDFIHTTVEKSGHKVAIVPFKPSAKIDFVCRQNNWTLIANPTQLNRQIEDKIKFYSLCNQNKLPVIPSLISHFSEKSYLEAQNKFGQTLVVQTNFGWAGNSSHLSDNYHSLKSVIEENTIVKFSPFLKGYSLINNCCQTDRGLIQSPPGLQYTGLKELTNNPLATVGRQWPSLAPTHIQQQIKKITLDFSQILAKLNYKGYFGLDFLVNHDQVYLLECNPRLTASFALYTQMEINQKVTPLFLLHLAEFINFKSESDLNIDRFDNQHIIGSEITKKDSNGTTIKKYSDFIQFSNTLTPLIDQEIMTKVI